jgi:hypothetical protein
VRSQLVNQHRPVLALECFDEPFLCMLAEYIPTSWAVLTDDVVAELILHQLE